MFKHCREICLAFCGQPCSSNMSWFHIKRSWCYCWSGKYCYSKSVTYQESKVFYFLADRVQCAAFPKIVHILFLGYGQHQVNSFVDKTNHFHQLAAFSWSHSDEVLFEKIQAFILKRLASFQTWNTPRNMVLLLARLVQKNKYVYCDH